MRSFTLFNSVAGDRQRPLRELSTAALDGPGLDDGQSNKDVQGGQW